MKIPEKEDTCGNTCMKTYISLHIHIVQDCDGHDVPRALGSATAVLHQWNHLQDEMLNIIIIHRSEIYRMHIMYM